jgi:uncharacterized protein
MAIEITNNAEASRYELHVDGQLAGLIDYRLHDKRISLVHTEVLDAFAGRGLGGQLAKAALDDAHTHGYELIPLCPFVAEYIRQHPDPYLERVAGAYRSRLTQPTPGS